MGIGSVGDGRPSRRQTKPSPHCATPVTEIPASWSAWMPVRWVPGAGLGVQRVIVGAGVPPLPSSSLKSMTTVTPVRASAPVQIPS